MSSTRPRPLRPGVAFREGKLYLFHRESLLVMRPWGPAAGAWRLEQGKRWRALRPVMTLSPRRARRPPASRRGYFEEWPPESGSYQGVLPFRGPRASERRWRCWRAFFAEIPARAVALACDRGFPSRHWWVLQMLNRVGEAAFDLTDSNPALAFAIACSSALGLHHRWQMKLIRQLVAMRRRDAAAALGFAPPAGSALSAAFAVKVLSALPPRLTTVSRLLALRDLLASDTAAAELARKRLAHLSSKPLNAVVLAICTDLEIVACFTPRCLQEMSELCPTSKGLELVARGKALVLNRRYHVGSPKFESIEHLEKLYLKDASEMDDGQLELFSNKQKPFPKTPFAEHLAKRSTALGAHVEILDGPRRVIEVSESDGLCLASEYFRGFVTGEVTAWRITIGQETAVAGLLRLQGSDKTYYDIFEISGRFNEQASQRICDTALELLESSGHGPL